METFLWAPERSLGPRHGACCGSQSSWPWRKGKPRAGLQTGRQSEGLCEGRVLGGGTVARRTCCWWPDDENGRGEEKCQVAMKVLEGRRKRGMYPNSSTVSPIYSEILAQICPAQPGTLNLKDKNKIRRWYSMMSQVFLFPL